MTSRTMRWTARAGVAALAVGLAAPAAWAATTWSPSPTATKDVGVASAQYSFNYGSSIGKLKNGKIATAYTSDAGTVDSKQSVYARVGTVDATTKAVGWGAPKLLSPKTQISDRVSLATGKTNNNIYTSWASQTKYVIDPAAPRVAYFRANVAGTWNAPVKLSANTGRVDYPIVAGAGNNAYVVYTNSNTGDVILKYSADAGATFNTATIGTTTRVDGAEGLGGWPIVCADGTNVAAVWMDGTGDMRLAVSKNGGGTIVKTTINAGGTVGGDDAGWAQCDAVGSRVGITWNQDDGVYYAEWSTDTNSLKTTPTKAFALPGGGYNASYSGSTALIGATKVGIAAPLCVQDGCDYTSKTTRIDLKWLESTNSGVSWGAPEALADSSVAGKPLNDSPSALYYNATTRFVIYNGWNANYTNYRLYLSTGKG